jgi:hypothetical protein
LSQMRGKLSATVYKIRVPCVQDIVVGCWEMKEKTAVENKCGLLPNNNVAHVTA